MADAAIESGGFLPPSLPSPAPSNASSTNLSGLPHPRSRPLRAGSSKEEAARRYVEAKLLNIARRYAKKHQPPEPDDVHGYQNMSEVCKDLNEVVDVLWLSGTPSLQIPSLLNVALSMNTYLSAFAPSPISTFALLRKLDHAFASLLKGEDVNTGEILPGFETGKRAGMSKTDMVRLKSLVEATRVQIVEIMSNGDDFEEESNNQAPVADDSGIETDGAMSVDMESAWDEGDDGHNMDVARVYAGTIMQLGTLLSSDTSYDPVAS